MPSACYDLDYGFPVCLVFLFVSPKHPFDRSRPTATVPMAKVKVFLDCQTSCFEEYLRTEVTLRRLRPRPDGSRRPRADHPRGNRRRRAPSTRSPSSATAGLRARPEAADGHDRSDPDDVVRRQLATALRVGLLDYLRTTACRPRSRRHRPHRRGRRPSGRRARSLEPLGVQLECVRLVRGRGIEPRAAAGR